MTATVVLIKGDDPIVLADKVSEVMRRFEGADVDEFAGDEYSLDAAAMAAATPAMFGDRVVVLRNAARFAAADLPPLLEYLADPAPEASLVIVWEKGTTAGATAKPLQKKLTEAITAAGGEVINCGIPGGKARDGWLDQQIAEAAVRLTGDARRVLVDRLGEDVSRLGGVLRVLEATFGAGAKVGLDDIDPYLPGAGGVPPWDLTDAIDSGDIRLAVERVRRMMLGGERHPLQLMVTLHGHYEKMLRLEGARVAGEQDAAALLGIKGSAFPAKKALANARRLGGDGVREAFGLLARADVDLRGATALPPEAVIETLVARLANLSRRRSTAAGGRSGGRARAGSARR